MLCSLDFYEGPPSFDGLNLAAFADPGFACSTADGDARGFEIVPSLFQRVC
jgi:hypothetical protein